MFTANREGDRACREIGQVADQLQVLELQRRRAKVSGRGEYSVNRGSRIGINAEWIEGRLPDWYRATPDAMHYYSQSRRRVPSGDLHCNGTRFPSSMS